MTTTKKLIRNLHLWLGLISGLVVFIVAITGCCWVFKEEISALTQEDLVIEQATASMITPTEAKTLAANIFPGKTLHGVLYKDHKSPVEIVFYQAEPLFYQSAFVHPSTGEVLKTEDHLSGFFAFFLQGHLYLWLPSTIGTQIVRWTTAIFTLMLISGIILWWPKNKKNSKQRFTLRWKATTKWKRKNYDLHAIFGFYSSFLAFIFVLTGIIMAFPSVKDVVYYGLGGQKVASFLVPTGSVLKQQSASKPIDQLLDKLRNDYPNALDYEIHYPHSDSSAIYVEASNSDGLFYDSDFLYYDQSTLEEIPSATYYGKYAEANLPDTLLRMNYDTHIGAIFGLPGKMIAFLISLIIASLPITGFLMWYGRNFKKKSNKVKVLTKT